MNRKIDKAKKKKQSEADNRALQEKGIEASERLERAIHSLSELLNGQSEYDFKRLEKQLEKIDKSLDLTKYFTNLERSLKAPRTGNKTKIQDFSKLLKAVSDNKPLPVNIDLEKLEKAVVNIEQYISEQSEPSDQGAENYQPVRRVIKVGNRFIFDDNFSNAGGGGGGSSGGGSTTVSNFPSEYPLPAAQVATLAPPAAITGYLTESDFDTKTGSLTETAPATDTASSGLNGRLQRLAQRITSLIALLPGSLGQKARAASLAVTLSSEDITALTPPTPQTDALTDAQLRDTAVPVSGTVTATPTGTQNVDVTANTIGLSTSANQTNGTQQTKLTDGTNTVAVGSLGDGDGSRQSLVVDGRMRMYNGTSFDRIRGNTTDGLLVNLGANNDVTVTSGAITETNSAAIKAAVETIDNAISGSEMQVDVVGALPAGTNAIGKLSANSGVDIGDVDVTSSVSATLDHGSNLDIDTTAEQITTTSFAAKFGVTVKSAVDNTGTVYIGNSDVTAGTTAATDGFPLEPGESITLPVNNSNLLYAIGAAANQKVFWSAV